MFIGDRWQEIGNIEFVFVPTTEDAGYLEMHLPDPKQYAADHESDGALDWYNWGPRLN